MVVISGACSLGACPSACKIYEIEHLKVGISLLLFFVKKNGKYSKHGNVRCGKGRG